MVSSYEGNVAQHARDIEDSISKISESIQTSGRISDHLSSNLSSRGSQLRPRQYSPPPPVGGRAYKAATQASSPPSVSRSPVRTLEELEEREAEREAERRKARVDGLKTKVQSAVEAEEEEEARLEAERRRARVTERVVDAKTASPAPASPRARSSAYADILEDSLPRGWTSSPTRTAADGYKQSGPNTWSCLTSHSISLSLNR